MWYDSSTVCMDTDKVKGCGVQWVKFCLQGPCAYDLVPKESCLWRVDLFAVSVSCTISSYHVQR